MNLQTEREFALKVIREAAVLLRPYMDDADKRHDSTRRKAIGEVVTEADQQANTFIVNAIADKFPQDAVCAEEGSDRDDPEAGRRWLLDPIDGTRSFIDGRPGYSLMLALAIDGEPVLGVVHDPVDEVTWFATKDEGVWRLDKDGRDRVMQGESKKAQLVWSPFADEAGGQAVADGLGADGPEMCESFGLRAIRVLQHGAGAFGSRPGSPHLWDTACAWVILHESGGTVTGYDGQPLMYWKAPSIHPQGAVASLGMDHSKVCELMAKHLPAESTE
jgi:3'(2'), 5'-bisphosphate nucleotidase